MVRVGVLLQWLGIFAIFYNMKQTKGDFNIPSTFHNFKQWLNNAPKYAQPSSITIDADTLVLSHVTVAGVTLIDVAHWNNEKSVDENIATNIKILNRCIDDIEKLEQRINCKIEEVNHSFANEILHINSLLNDLKKDVNKVATGGINLTFVSSMWILIGITISTIPDDVIFVLSFLF